MGVIFEELGRTLTSPMFSTAVCASLIKEVGNEDQKKYLTKIASGDITLLLL